jgi:hypothetical protein
MCSSLDHAVYCLLRCAPGVCSVNDLLLVLYYVTAAAATAISTASICLLIEIMQCLLCVL